MLKEEIDNLNELYNPGRGFDIGLTHPKLFTVGRRLDLEQQLLNLEFPRTLTLFLFQVDVGHTYCFPEKVLSEQCRLVKLPEGYDSVYVQLKDKFNGESATSNTYHRNYLIYEGSKLTPMYKVVMKMQNKVPMPFTMAKNETKVCEECKKPAVVFCRNEKAFFCAECDVNWHNLEN